MHRTTPSGCACHPSDGGECVAALFELFFSLQGNRAKYENTPNEGWENSPPLEGGTPEGGRGGRFYEMTNI
ncbi:hypothetical protein AGMMS50289_16750 [Betaproteobacteria bacterium]|nr:hypothetical protein AGMMS50289_16750 [Betaproteobacteria bacterium]